MSIHKYNTRSKHKSASCKSNNSIISVCDIKSIEPEIGFNQIHDLNTSIESIVSDNLRNKLIDSLQENNKLNDKHTRLSFEYEKLKKNYIDLEEIKEKLIYFSEKKEDKIIEITQKMELCKESIIYLLNMLLFIVITRILY